MHVSKVKWDRECHRCLQLGSSNTDDDYLNTSSAQFW